MSEKPTYEELEQKVKELEKLEVEHKRTEQIVRDSEQKFKSIVESSPMGIHLYKLEQDGRLVFIGANPAADAILGTDNKQFIGKTIEEAFPPLINTEVPERYRLACSKGKSWQTEQINYEHDQIKGAYLVNAFQTSPGMMAALFLDVTERKLAEEALRTSQERFLTVLDSIDATIYVADLETYEILFMNKYMVESFGRDMTGEICWDVFRGESGPCPHCTNDQLLDKNGKPADVCVWQDENPITGKWYINYDRAIAWTDGRLVRLQIATDITQMKAMESQIQQSQKYEAIGTLAGGIAHDFNNLLMGIQGRASLMAVDLDPSHSHKEHVSAIEEYIRNATDLTKKLLGFARGGKYEVKPTDLNELVLNSSNMFGRTKKEIRIHTKLHNPPPVVAVDRKQIDQVLLNLYINAWQAMPHGGELYLETRVATLDDAYCKPYRVKPGRYAKVSVTDTGIGMDASVSQRVFDPFFTTKEKERGTGLGLASTYGIVKNHDGIITVYSEAGHGTTFNIYLPLSEQEAYRDKPAEAGVVKGRETILLVDDEEMIIEVAQAMLERLGYRVIDVSSGKQAVEVISEAGNEIDLVILDMIMPGMDGGKAFDRIREIQPGIPVMLSSGYAINGQATEIMRRGCNGFLQKPFNISELSKKVRKILDNAKSSNLK